MHIDLGPARRWGEPFPPRATPFVQETPPAREVLADSRTRKGSGAAGIATVGAAGVEVAQQVLGMPPGINLLPRNLMALRNLRHRRPADAHRHNNLELVLVAPEAPTLHPKNFAAHRRPHIKHVANDVVKHVS